SPRRSVATAATELRAKGSLTARGSVGGGRVVGGRGRSRLCVLSPGVVARAGHPRGRAYQLIAIGAKKWTTILSLRRRDGAASRGGDETFGASAGGPPGAAHPGPTYRPLQGRARRVSLPPIPANLWRSVMKILSLAALSGGVLALAAGLLPAAAA